MMETKNNKQSSISLNWLWGSVLIVLGVAALLGQLIPGFGGLVWAAFFVGGGTVFLTIYLRNKEQWWALIPGYALAVVGGIILLAESDLDGNITGTFVMFAIALPFVYVYMLNRRENWWALIPAYATSAIGAVIAVSDILYDSLMASFIMFAIALPFFYVYLRNRQENWWALIPGYATSAIGVFLIFVDIMPEVLTAPFVLFAIALPFFVVYLQNHNHWWALIPAGIMATIGIGLLIAEVQYIVPVVFIILGIFLLGRQVSGGRSKEASKTGPDADKPPSV
ncbi:MAG: hypothetical protein JXB07_04080 [Anaerolineae bacterium]|nr:hypothetical protein [Anaerolineae bacterium]